MKDLLLATALIALGTVAVVTPFKYPPEPGPPIWRGAFPFAFLLFSGVAMIGAGLLAPWKKAWLGAAGAVLALVALLGYLFALTDVFIRY